MKNKVQFQKGYSLIDFMKEYGTEEQCRTALFQWRWPNGFHCSECGSGKYCTLKQRPVFQCNNCHHHICRNETEAHYLVFGNVFDYLFSPIFLWFGLPLKNVFLSSSPIA